MDMKEYLITDNYRLHMIKNLFQFMISLTLFLSSGASPDIFKIIVASLGFVISYQSIYILNDIQDYQEDSKNEFKKRIKPFARGDISIEKLVSRMFLYLAIGIPLSFFIGPIFGFVVILALLCNFIHSDKRFGAKETRLGLANFFIMESAKFSAGWFVLGGTFSNLPYFIIFFMSAVYTLSYFIYKNDSSLSHMKRRRSILFILLSVIFYTTSLYLYPANRTFLLGMFILLALPPILKRNSDVFLRVKETTAVVLYIFVFLNLVNIAVLFEPFASINLFLASLF